MADLASAWAMTRRRPREYRRKVDEATRCSGVCPHTRPDLTMSMLGRFLDGIQDNAQVRSFCRMRLEKPCLITPGLP